MWHQLWLRMDPKYHNSNLTDPRELGAFMDGVINAQLMAHHIPGATVAVVKDG